MITGGGRGIGKAAALGFARLGANTVIASRTAAELAQTGDEIRAAGGRCLEVQADIRDVAAVERLRDAALAECGAVDYVINNAGGQYLANPFTISDNGWRAVVDLNLNGTWNMCSRFLPHLMERGRGSVVNVVHVYSFERGSPLFAHSGAARAGVVNLTRSLAPFCDQRGVTINALAPGTTITPNFAPNYAKTPEGVEEERAASQFRFADPEDMAAIMLFLCSPAARMVNGAVLVADAASTQCNWPELDAMLEGFTAAP